MSPGVSLIRDPESLPGLSALTLGVVSPRAAAGRVATLTPFGSGLPLHRLSEAASTLAFARNRSTTSGSRSALEVSHLLGGFLRCFVGRFVAPCLRSWGSKRFSSSPGLRTVPVPFPVRASCEGRGGGSPLRLLCSPNTAFLVRCRTRPAPFGRVAPPRFSPRPLVAYVAVRVPVRHRVSLPSAEAWVGWRRRWGLAGGVAAPRVPRHLPVEVSLTRT